MIIDGFNYPIIQLPDFICFMRTLWPMFICGGVVAAVLAGVRPSVAKPEYTRRTKKECSFCHPPGGYTLNDAGKYYRDHRALDGYKPKASFSCSQVLRF